MTRRYGFYIDTRARRAVIRDLRTHENVCRCSIENAPAFIAMLEAVDARRRAS